MRLLSRWTSLRRMKKARTTTTASAEIVELAKGGRPNGNTNKLQNNGPQSKMSTVKKAPNGGANGNNNNNSGKKSGTAGAGNLSDVNANKNAHSMLYGPGSNRRGEEFMDFILTNGLDVENVGMVPTFVANRASGIVKSYAFS